MLQVEIDTGDMNRFFADGNAHPDWCVKGTIVSVESVAEKVHQAIANGYQRMTVYIEDTIICVPEPGKLIAFDAMSGKTASADVSPEQLSAILTLGIVGDEAKDSETLYPIAESVVGTWPSECRPIP